MGKMVTNTEQRKLELLKNWDDIRIPIFVALAKTRKSIPIVKNETPAAGTVGELKKLKK